MTTDAITVVAKFTFDEAVVGEQRTRLWKVKPSNLRKIARLRMYSDGKYCATISREGSRV